MLLSKDAIMSTSDLPTEVVEVKQWGGSVKVRGMNAGERDTFEEAIRKHGMANLRSLMASMTIINEDGSRMFTDKEVNKLSEKSAEALDTIIEVASRLSGLTDSDVEVLEGN
jgi:hypothetical protein